jgi:signal transduction histidine kinase
MSSDIERPVATVPLPNALAHGIAVAAVATTAALPFAFAAADMSLTEVVAGYYAVSSALFAVLGSLILWRHPGHGVGWILVAIGGFDLLSRLTDLYQMFDLARFSSFPPYESVEAYLSWAWVQTVAGTIIVLPQLFPNGRLLSRRWRPLAWFGAAAIALLSVDFILDPDGYEPLIGPAFLIFGMAGLASMVPLVLRYRGSSGVERQQLKWAYYGFAISVPMLVIGTSGVFFGAVGAIWATPPLVVIPVTITVAVLRYRLYDIDVVISRTLLVAGLAGFITVTYVAIVVGIGSLVGRGDEPNLILSIAATTLVAVAFQPVRRRLQRVANRMVFGRRATPYEVLSGFATRVGAAEASPETLLGVAELMADGTGARPARVWLRVGSQLRLAATWPIEQATTDPSTTIDADTLPEADLAVPVREQDELLGVLTIAKPRGERVTEVDEDLVERLAAASGVLLRNLRLDAELAQRLDEIEASRRRLVSAQDDARRRIEAELGGGTRAQLRTLGGRLMGLQRDVDAAATPKTAVLLGQLVTSTNTALDTLAGLAAGVYPPQLAAEGLVTALSEQAGRAAVPVDVQATGVGRYSADVEAAVYFAVLEALQNVAKYADATAIQVRLTNAHGRLTFEVADDGAGFDTDAVNMGTGLQGIVDRLDTVDGTISIDSTPGSGTTVTGTVPVIAASRDVAPALAGAGR